jgi:transposase
MDTAEHNTEVGAVRLRQPDRTQMVMVTQCPDDLIPQTHQARVIWQVVQSLDLSKFCQPIKARQGVCGRDATDPRLLASLWLYGNTCGVGSARELDRLCQESKPYQWLCGGVSVNYHTLSDFRVQHGAALDELFTQIIATLVHKKVIKVFRISQDGLRKRACAGASSFRRSEGLAKLLEEAKQHVAELKSLLDDPEKSAGLSAKKKAAQQRAARERQQRIEEAIKILPELKKKQEKRAKKVSQKDKATKLKEPRASTTDAEAKVMKMGNGGYNPAVNIQFATDTHSRAIVGVSVSGEGNDHHLAEPMRQQVEQRTGQEVQEHLIDGGFLVMDEIERAAAQGVTLYVPPKPSGKNAAAGSEYQPKLTDSQVIREWRERMSSEEGREIYKQRAATSETVNADVQSYRGLGPRLLVRGLKKSTCVALWSAMAYNILHFGWALVG